MKKYIFLVLLVASVFAQSRDCSYSTVSGAAVASPNIGTIDLVLSFDYDCIGFGNADGVQFNFPDGFSSYVNSWAITGNGNVCSFGTDSGQNCNNLEGTYDGDSLLFGTVGTGNGFGAFENSNVFTVNVDPWFAGDPIDAFEMLTIGYIVYDGNFNPVNGVGEFTIIEFSEAIIEHVISTSANFASCVYTEDLDGDGDMDVLSASRNDDKIAWYDNDGSGSFTEYVISTSADGASSVYAEDIDGDGDIDVLSASVYDYWISWYENDGSENFTEYTIPRESDFTISVYAEDVDGDGDMDLLSASQVDNTIAWYENDGSESFTEHAISISAHYAHSVYAEDVDGDGDMDVLSASRYDNKIAWYENDGSESFTEHAISTSAYDARSVYAIDIDSDGDMDVLSATSSGITWYENNGSESFTGYAIPTSSYSSVRSIYASDLDGDGDIDVFSASSTDDKISFYENDGSENFTEFVLSTSADNAWSVHAADLDGDGDMDVLSASLSDNKVAWYETTWYWYENNGCTADDGTEGVELWGECYSIENTTDLNLTANQLTGSIPSEVGNLINLMTLSLGDNQLTGSIPSEIGNLTNLEYLRLEDNQLTGSIPPEIGNLTNLIYLWLHDNQLSGIIPDEICNQGDTSPSLYNNQLCPPYPSCIEDYVGEQDSSNCEQVSIIDETLPVTYALYNAYPNPFNPVTTIRYDLPGDKLVNIIIYDMLGRQVTQLVNATQKAGYRSVQWNATDFFGKPVSTGVYIYQIRAGEFVQTRKMVLLK